MQESVSLDFGPEWFASHRNEVMAEFLRIQRVPALRAWQQAFVERPLEEQVNSIIQLPPGAGKTLLAQWVMIEQLAAYPAGRVVFAVPLRVLAKQLTDDVAAVLGMLNDLAGVRFRVQLAEGPGATVNLISNNVLVCTYEHAVGELRKDPQQAEQKRFVSLVIVDEIHNIAKGDRGMVIDDVLFFSQMRRNADRRHRPAVLGMSGTLPDWVCSRLVDSYPDMFRMVYTPELLGIEQQDRPKAARLMLPANKFRLQETVLLVRDIVKGLLAERIENPDTPEDWRRLVVFMSSVAEAETAFVMVASDPEIPAMLARLAETRRYVHPVIKLVNSLSTLQEKFNGKNKNYDLPLADPGTKAADIAQALMRAGVYIHHAQLTGEREHEAEGERVPGWSDQIQEQLAAKDFVAVFSTSTLSVGINLNSTQIGVLGPNSLWTIDQAEQMIGRVGRVDRDAARSFVLVVDSVLYRAPGVASIMTPDTWFVPRIAAAIDFLAAAQRRAAENGKPDPVTGNLDIRGFFRPADAAAISVPDAPASGLLPLARAWGLVDKRGITRLADIGLTLCKQDLKSLPATVFLLQIPGIRWTTVLLWAMLMCRLPQRWDRLFANECGESLCNTSMMPRVPRDQAAATKLIHLYGDAHESHQGDDATPGRANAARVIEFFRHLFWAMAAFPGAWFTKDPADLVDYAVGLASFLNAVTQDVTPLVRAGQELSMHGADMDLQSVLNAFDKATTFAVGFAIGYRGGPHPAAQLRLTKPDPERDDEIQAAYSATMRKAYQDLSLDTDHWIT